MAPTNDPTGKRILLRIDRRGFEDLIGVATCTYCHKEFGFSACHQDTLARCTHCRGSSTPASASASKNYQNTAKCLFWGGLLLMALGVLIFVRKSLEEDQGRGIERFYFGVVLFTVPLVWIVAAFLYTLRMSTVRAMVLPPQHQKLPGFNYV